ncbi:MAG: AEC family transporter [Parvibaculaceae bacterium]|nr:AEC family transporter [Parvibaculaceae bacterium]
MISTLLVVLPIFALIFLGWMARRANMLGANATTEINRFVVNLALPALLFDILAHARWSDIWQPGFILAFGLGSLAVFGLTIAIRLRQKVHLADAVVDGLNAGYANTGFMGFPLALAVLGPAALAPTSIATILTVCVIFAFGIILIEAGLQTEARRSHLVLKVAGALIRNPLLIAPAAGALVLLAGLSVPAPVETIFKLLGGAASPCALVALGLFLAEKRKGREEGAGTGARTGAVTISLLVGFKLILQPLVTWLLASFVFHLPPPLIHVAVLIAALPTGTGSFMLAEFYRREASVTSRVILISTILSILTVSAYIAIAV